MRPTEAPIPDATDVKPVVEIPSSNAQPQPPKVEDPSLNEVGGSKGNDNVSGVDSGLLVDEPKPQVQVS